MDASGDLLRVAAEVLHDALALGAPAGPPTTPAEDTAAGLLAYQVFDTPAGPVCLEVHQAVDGGPPEIWVCVPRQDLPGVAAAQHYDWFRYRQATSGRIVPDGGPLQISPSYGPWPWTGTAPDPQPPLANDGDWAHQGRYFLKQVISPGKDPPHWSPMLVLTDEAQPFIGAIHARMQDPATRDSALRLLDQARPAQTVSLSRRVMNNWQPVTLRGVAVRSSFTENDFALEHATGYIRAAPNGQGIQTPTGTLLQMDATNPNWPGLDWHIDVRPDPDVRYLTSPGQPERIAVEIEHFALPVEYRPQVGEWLQVVGRWIIDAGHVESGMREADGFHTEIHPEELLVASRPDAGHALGTLARVVVTGAWQGLPLDFVVYPPPRPVADAHLHWAVTDEWRQRATLTITPWPANANHLVCTVTTDDTAPLLMYPNGMVGMTDTRGYHAVITCWWDVPAAQVGGRLAHGADPAQGSYLFYAPAAQPALPWRQVAVDATGSYTIPALAPGPYLVRPAGSAWNYAAVPHPLTLTDGPQAANFSATPAPPVAGPPGDLSAFALHREERPGWQAVMRQDGRQPLGPQHPVSLQTWTFDLAAAPDSAAPADGTRELAGTQMAGMAVAPRIGLDLQARQVAAAAPAPGDAVVVSALADAFLTLREPAGPLGVRGNGLGYAEGGRLYVNLARLDDSQGQPITGATRALSRLRLEEVDTSGHPWISQDVVQIHGRRGPGVAGATVQARLWMAAPAGVANIVADATTSTDADGTARFDLTPGTHMAEVVLTVEILSNPANPWLLPRTRTAPYLFYPAATGDDSGPAEPYTLVAASATRDLGPGPADAAEARLQRIVQRRLQTQQDVADLSADDGTRGLGRPPMPPVAWAPPPAPPTPATPVEVATLETVTRATFPRPVPPEPARG